MLFYRRLPLFALPLMCLCAPAQTPQPAENPYTELHGDSAGLKDPSGLLKPTPRTRDGKPDLSGFWKGPLIFGGMFKDFGGKPPFTTAGAAAYQYNLTKSINPEGLCLFAAYRAPASAVSRLRSFKTRIGWCFCMS